MNTIKAFNVRQQRSQSSHGFEEPHLLALTQPTQDHMEHRESPEFTSATQKIQLETKRITLLRENAKFLKKKLKPLNQNNEQLRHHVLALTYYLEQRRIDFASLLKNHDKEGQPRELEKNLGDLVDIYEALKEDLKNDEESKAGYQKETQGLKELLRQESMKFEQRFDEYEAQLSQRKHEHAEQLKQKDIIIANLQKEIALNAKSIADLNYKIINYDEIHKAEVLKKQRDIEYHIAQAVYVENHHQQEIINLKEAHQSQLIKDEVAHRKQLQDQKSECEDLINKNELKYKKALVEFNNMKQEQVTIVAQRNQLQSQSEKQQVKLETQIIENKRLRSELAVAKEHVEQANAQIQEFMAKASKLQKEKDDSLKKIKLSNEYLENQQQERAKIEAAQAQLRKMLTDEREQHEDEIKKLNKLIGDKDIMWRKKLYNQQQKFEKILRNSQPLQNDENEDSKARDGDIYQTLDVGCQIDNDEQDLKIKTLEKSNLELNKQLQIRIQSEKNIAAKAKQDLEEKKKQLIKESQQQVKQLTEQLEKELEDKIESLKFKAQQESEFNMLQQAKMEQDNNAILLVLDKKVKTYEQEIQSLQEKLNEQQEKYIESRHQMYQNEELIQNDRIQEIKRHEIEMAQMQEKYEELMKDQLNIEVGLKIQINQKLEEVKGIQQKMDEKQQHVVKVEKSKEELSKQQRSLQLQLQRLQAFLEEREKLISQQNDVIRYLQLEIENSKQVYNIFKGRDHVQERQHTMKIVDPETEQPGYVKAIILHQHSRRVKPANNKDQKEQKEKDEYNLNFNIKRTERMPIGRINSRNNQSQPLINRTQDQSYIPNIRANIHDDDTSTKNQIRTNASYQMVDNK